MVFGRKKKKKEIVLPMPEEETGETEETEEKLPQGYDEKMQEMDKRITGLKKLAASKQATTIEEQPTGEFSLNEEEMALSINALASSEEYKLYQQMVIGQQIATMIEGYRKVITARKGNEPEE